MTLTADKNQLFKLLLAAYFLVSSISPLTYTLSNRQVTESIQATNNNASGIKNVRKLLCEFFTERLSFTEENPHNNASAFILVKKISALTPENASEEFPLFKHTSVPEDFHKPSAPTVYSLNDSPGNIFGIYKGFNPLYAGNSPPSV